MVAVFVLLTFFIFIVADIIVLKLQKKKHPAFESDIAKPVFNKKSIYIPEKIFISKGHTWVELQPDGLLKVGIDDLVVKALGKVKLNFSSEEGRKINQGEIIITGTCNENKFNFRSPVDGIIKKINKELSGKILENPYKEWGIVVESTSFESNKKNLKSGNELKDWLKEEFNRLKDFLGIYPLRPELAGVTMHDGGNIIEGAVINISNEGLKKFEKEFLTL